MKLITGDECGLLKECNPGLAMKGNNDQTKGLASSNSSSRMLTTEKEGILRINPIEHASRRHGVVALAWNEPGRDDRFSSLHMDGVVELWESSSRNDDNRRKPSFGKYRHAGTIANVFGITNEGNNIDPSSRPMGLSRLCQNGNNLLCACNHDGKVVVLDPNIADEHRVSSFDAFPVKSSSTHDSSNNGPYPRVSTMAVNEPTGRVAIGGKERETTMFDLETSKQVWKAKNLPPDAQTLLQPQVWPTAIVFLRQDSPVENVLAVGTAYAQVRLYDVRVGSDSGPQRRPIQTTPAGFLEHRVTSLCQIGNSNEIVVGDAAGFLHSIDLRKLPAATERVQTPLAKQEQVGTHGRFVGPSGSIRQIVHDNNNNKLAVVGLDRMLRIYDTGKKRKELICFYLKQRLNCVLVGQEEKDDDHCFDSEHTAENVCERCSEDDMDQEDVVDDYFDSDDEDDCSSSSENEDGGQRVADSDSGSDDNDNVVHTRKKQKQ